MYRTVFVRRSRLQPLVVRPGRKQLSQKPLPVLRLQYKTLRELGRSERLRKSMSSRSLSGMAARKPACSTVLGGIATALRKKHMSPLSCSHSPSLTSIGKQLRRSDRDLATRHGHSITHSRTDDESRSALTSKKKTASLKSGWTTATATGPWMMKRRKGEVLEGVQTETAGRGTFLSEAIDYGPTDRSTGPSRRGTRARSTIGGSV